MVVVVADKIHGYSHWARCDRRGGQGDDIALCHCDDLQADVLLVNTPDELEIMFAHLILVDGSGLLLCGSNSLAYLKDNQDNIIVSHNCQNVVVVGDLNQQLVARDSTEWTVVQELQI